MKKIATALSVWSLIVTAIPSTAKENDENRANDEDKEDRVGAVYTMSNDPSGNAVLVFNRAGDGSLTPGGTVSTGGLGTGGREPDFGLANAHALALSDDGHLLFVVNPGSNDVSVFKVKKKGLKLVDRESSGGAEPISVTVKEDLVYVLNAGGNAGSIDSITGFTVSSKGKLRELSDSTRPLSADMTGPAQIGFTPNGKVLIVTERVANNIDTYTVGEDGRATGPTVTPSDAESPFGFYSNHNQVFISDDFNDAPGAGALSSYIVSHDGIQLVSSAVPANESGACWVIVSQDGRFAYVVNTVSSTISLYTINREDARVTFDRAFSSFASPTDLDFSRDGRFLYVLNPDQNGQSIPSINVFQVNKQDGGLVALPSISGLPTSVDGLVAR